MFDVINALVACAFQFPVAMSRAMAWGGGPAAGVSCTGGLLGEHPMIDFESDFQIMGKRRRHAKCEACALGLGVISVMFIMHNRVDF
jgi:hypothetical protein